MDIRHGTLVLAFALGTAATAALPAQSVDSHCTDPAIVGVTLHGGDACQKVADLFNYMNMQIGTWCRRRQPDPGTGRHARRTRTLRRRRARQRDEGEHPEGERH